MANIKSSKKRAQLAEAQRQRNASFKSRVRTSIKKVTTAIEAGDQAAANELLRAAQSELGKASVRGIFKKNKVSRDMSRLNARVKAMA